VRASAQFHLFYRRLIWLHESRDSLFWSIGEAMNINLLSEQRISVNDLAAENSVTPGTVWRWLLTGLNGHRLESVLLGGRRFTSREALNRWLEKVNRERMAESA
jgi:hypothetical protein